MGFEEVKKFKYKFKRISSINIELIEEFSCGLEELDKKLIQMKENDEKKWYLRGYERAIREMKRSEERIREMRINRICPSVIADGMPHASGGSDLSGYAARLDEEERKYQKARYLRIKRCQEISDKIERLVDEDEKDVLFFRYIKLMKWEDIAVKMGFSWQHIHKIHANALKHFQI